MIYAGYELIVSLKELWITKTGRFDQWRNKHLPYTITLPYIDINQNIFNSQYQNIIDKCCEDFGNPLMIFPDRYKKWSYEFVTEDDFWVSYYKLWFRRESDYILFRMKYQ